ncbi:MAG: AAA family ATPase [Gemmatimonadota bacterium]|nr:AAA family ATPase [Gemmatimonadota bacterium]
MSERSASEHSSPVTFRFENIGPVKDAALGLSRLTIIAGRNNTGKTYIAYSLYGFLKTWGDSRAGARHRLKGWRFFGDFVEGVSAMLRDSGRAEMPVSLSAIADHRRSLARELGVAFSMNLPGVFSSRRDSFPGAAFHIDMDDDTAAKLPSPLRLPFGRTAIAMTHDGTDLVAQVDGSRESHRGAPSVWSVAQAYCVFLLRDVLPDPFILSAERFGISLFYRELDFRKNQLVDLLQKLGDERPRKSVSPYVIIDRATSRYAMPIKDNIDFTRDIPDLPKDGSALADYRLFDDVKDLVGGYYGNATEDIRFISKARGKGRSFNIPLHLASSSARGLSDLYFFLRHTATRDQLLIIDEPESHLDTRNQMLFARMLARFVTAGLRVLISTHSDYLVKELNNLIMLSRDFPEREAVARKLGYQPDEGLDPGSVRAYVAEGGGLTECEIGPFGIEMPVFDDTIDQINEASIELSSRAVEGS